jgi:hypothetical protein
VSAAIALEQDGNRIKLRYVSSSSFDGTGILYRIECLYRTVVTSVLNDGKLTVSVERLRNHERNALGNMPVGQRDPRAGWLLQVIDHSEPAFSGTEVS